MLLQVKNERKEEGKETREHFMRGAPARGSFRQGTLEEKGRETETGDTKNEVKTN